MPTSHFPQAGETEGGGSPCARARAGGLYSEIPSLTSLNISVGGGVPVLYGPMHHG